MLTYLKEIPQPHLMFNLKLHPMAFRRIQNIFMEWKYYSTLFVKDVTEWHNVLNITKVVQAPKAVSECFRESSKF